MLSINPNIDTVIDFKNVCKSFGEKKVLDDVSFSVDHNEVLAVVGPSGTGKSTILKIVCGLIPADSGNITLSSSKKGMAFQFSALLNFLSVKENVALPLVKEKILPQKEIDEKVYETLESVGLAGTENLYPSELSGGMQKRVSFARAIISNPDILLYDEPTSGLDPMTSTMIIDDISKLKQLSPAAGIIVTHDLSTIDRAADKVLLLYKGKAVFMGTPKEFKRSDNKYASQFYNGLCTGPMEICPHTH